MIFERTFEPHCFRDQENACLSMLDFIRQLFDKLGYTVTFIIAHDTKTGALTLKAEYHRKRRAKNG